MSQKSGTPKQTSGNALTSQRDTVTSLEIAVRQIPTKIATARHGIAWASLKPSD